jgi:ribosome biogenesis SPOUT family RNA methylase Rps3
MAIYIIEHLEPELWEWCLIEYESISKIVGKERLWFTNIKNAKDAKRLERFGKVFKESVKEMKLDNACVLDPEVPKTLNPREAKSFSYFIFGGILGDYPPRKRTKEELTKYLGKIDKRNIGKKQFSTDNAVKVVSLIESGKKFEDIETIDNAEIKINKIESIELPFTYVYENGKPFMSDKIIAYLKKKKEF